MSDFNVNDPSSITLKIATTALCTLHFNHVSFNTFKKYFSFAGKFNNIYITLNGKKHYIHGILDYIYLNYTILNALLQINFYIKT